MKTPRLTKLDKDELSRIQEAQPFLSLNDVIYDFLFDQIIRLQIAPGAKLNENNIAKSLGISRTPVHAALLRLVEDKLITKETGKFPFAIKISPSDCLSLTQARIAIESVAGYQATINITSEQLGNLKKLATKYEKQASKPDAPGFETSDHAFHCAIVNACANPYLIETYDVIKHRLLHFRYYLRYQLGGSASLKESMARTITSHHAICRAMELGFPSVVQEELIRHTNTNRDVFAKWLSSP